MWQRFLKMMGLKHSDTVKILWTLFLTFLSGAILCFTSSLPMALFLSHYGSENLPSIYLAAAFTSMLVGFVYAMLERNIIFKKLVVGLTTILALALMILGTCLATFDNPWIIIIMLVWCIMMYDQVEFSIWSVINSAYTIQQAKKSFGIIGGFQSVGGISAGFMSPFLVSLLGVKWLIVGVSFLALGLVVTMFTLIKIAKIEGEAEEDEEDDADDETETASFKTIRKISYILKIIALVVLGVFCTYIVDLIFNSAAEAHYPEADKLAGFLGVFLGCVDGVDLIFSIVLFGWFLKRFGIVLTLYLLPIIGLILSIPILILCNIPAGVGILFWLIAGLKLWEECCRASLTEMSQLLLLQPFTVKVRVFLQSKLDSIVIGFSTAVVSVILIIITKTFGPSIPVLTTLAIVFFAITFLLLLTLKSDYMKAVSKAIAGHFFERNKNVQLSKEDLLLLEKYLLSPHPDEVIYALHFIEQIDTKELPQRIRTVLNSSTNPTTLKYVIDIIYKHRFIQFYPDLISLLDNANETIQIKALKAAAELNYESIKDKVRQLIHLPSLKVASTVLIIALNKEQEKAEFLQEVNTFAFSEDPKNRAKAAYIISKAPDELLYLLDKLCQDNDKLVMESAFYAAIKLKQTQFYEDIIKKLNSISINLAFAKVFKREIHALFPILERLFSELPIKTQLKMLDLLLQVKEEITKPFIEQQALHNHFSIREAALRALPHVSKVFSKNFIESLHKQIISESIYIQSQQEELALIPQNETTELLISVIELKKSSGLKRLMLALSLYYDFKSIQKSANGLKSKREEDKSYAIELIDNMLHADHKKIISPLLINIFLVDQLSSTTLDSPAFHQALKNNLRILSVSESEAITQLTYAATAYIVLKNSIKECFKEVDNLKTTNNSKFIQETLNWLTELKA